MKDLNKKLYFKKRKYVEAFMLLMIIAFCCIGCAEKQVEWSEKKHNRTEEFGYVFNYQATAKNGVTYAIDVKLDESIEKDTLVDQIDEDIKKIVKFTDLEIESLSIFILKNTLDEKTTIDEVSNTLYLPYEKIETLEYYEDLVRVITKEDSNWKIYGISRLIFDMEGEPDRIKSDFEDNKNNEILYMSGGVFLEGWNTVEEIETAKNLATCATYYSLGELEFEEFCSLSTSALVGDYLKSLEIEYQLDEVKGRILDCYYFTSDETYEVVAKSEKMDFYFSTAYENISTSEMLNKYIVNSEKGYDYIYEFFTENYISMEYILSEQEKPNVYIGNFGDDAASFCMADGVYINVNGGLISLFHELGHYYSNANYDSKSKSMENEGYAEYISDVIAQDYFSYGEEKLYYYNLLKEGTNEDSYPHEIAFYEWYYNTYDELQVYEEFDMREVVDFVAYRLKTKPEDFEGFFSAITLEEWGYGGEHVDMTYSEAGSFVAYLIDQSSVDLLVKYLNEPISYEECFGKSYETLFDEWEAYLEKCYN